MTTPADTARRAILGIPYDPGKKPERHLLVQAFEEQSIVAKAVNTGSIVKDTKANLDLVTAAPEDQMAWVVGDATPANNGIYENTGTASATVWTRRADIPQGVIPMTDVGAGTANAIVTTTPLAVPATLKALFILFPFEVNTGAVTLANNGAAAKPLKDVAGADLLPGALSATQPVLLAEESTRWRMLNDYASAANQELARLWANGAEDVEPDPVDHAGQYSAMHWRNKAEDQAGYSEEWAQSPSLITVPAGGNGTTDRSSMWHADRADAAAIVASGAMSAIVIAENTFSTISTAEAWAPVAAPDYIRTAGYASPGDGGGCLYRKVLSEPSHAGKFSITLDDAVTVVWYEIVEGPSVNVACFGVVGDGVTANDAAFNDVLEYAFRSADLYDNVKIVFPRGEFLFTSNNPWGQWVTSPVARGHVVFEGAGRYATTIKFQPVGAGPFRLYSGETSGGGAGSDNQWVGALFRGLLFQVDGTNVSSGMVTLFRQYPKSGTPAQNFQFVDCYFIGDSKAQSVMEVRGGINGSENAFFNCTARGFVHILDLGNAQAVNNYAFGCNWELMNGDVYYITGGGMVSTFGGSIILSSASDAYLINCVAGAGGLVTTNVFVGVRTELRNVYAKLARLTGIDNANVVVFDGCDFAGGLSGGARNAVVVDGYSSGRVIFDHGCYIPGDLNFAFGASGTANYWTSQSINGEIHVIRSKIDPNVHDKVTWGANAKGLFRVRECWAGGGSAASTPTVSLDCDMLNGGFGRSRRASGPTRKSSQALVVYWPTVTLNRTGLDSQIKLPPGAFLESVTVKKVAFGGSGSSYQLALTNEDGSFCYGLSTIAVQSAIHSIAYTAGRVLATSADRTLKLTSTVTIGYDTQTGNFALGETVTGGTSGATGVVVQDVDGGTTGTLTLALTTGTFQVAEALTGSIAGAANCASVTSRLGGAVAQTMAAGDLFGVTYW